MGRVTVALEWNIAVSQLSFYMIMLQSNPSIKIQCKLLISQKKILFQENLFEISVF